MSEEPVDVISPLPPPERDGFPPFLPSATLAQMALSASEEDPFSCQGIAIAPQGPPEPDGSNLLERVRQSVGTRIDRMFATLAYRAAACGHRELLLSHGEKLTQPVREGLLRDLLLDPERAEPVLEQLHRELTEEARAGRFGGDWGCLAERDGSLVLAIVPEEEPAPLPAEAPARVVGGTVFRQRRGEP